MHFVREATEHDTAALDALYQECCQEADWLPAAMKQKVNFARDTEGERLWVALDTGNEVVGFIAVWMPDSFIHHLYVASSVWGRGIGHALLNALEDQIPTPWRLKCLKANTRAHSFYLRYGWQTTEEGEDAGGAYWVMEWTG